MIPAAPWAMPAAALAAAVIVLVLVPPLRRVALRVGYLDHPEARKAHARVTPLLGGVAVAAGTLLGAGAVIRQLGVPVSAPAAWWTAGGLLALVCGLVDDRFGMHPAVKLLLQGLAAAAFLAGGVYPGAGVAAWLALPLGLLWIVAMMNAVNFLDNMDGIVGGMAAILSCGLGLLLLSWGRHADALLAAALTGASLAFLRFNFSPASVFLGDAGSLFLGYTLASLSLLAAEAGPDIQGSVAGLLILGYPVFDLSFVVLTRIRAGRKIYIGGTDHTTHRLRQLVGGPRRTALAVYAWALALTITGVGAAGAQSREAVFLWLALWALVLLALGLRLARVPVRPAAPPRDPVG